MPSSRWGGDPKGLRIIFFFFFFFFFFFLAYIWLVVIGPVFLDYYDIDDDDDGGGGDDGDDVTVKPFVLMQSYSERRHALFLSSLHDLYIVSILGSLCCASFTESEMPWSTFMPRLQNLAGRYLTLRSDFGRVKVNNIEVTSCDVTATNGVIHAIDGTITQGRRGWVGEWFSEE
jgi:hypothetical protein